MNANSTRTVIVVPGGTQAVDHFGVGSALSGVVHPGRLDEALGWDDGEGDRTLARWHRVHTHFLERFGASVNQDTPMVLERFELFWATREESAR